MSDNTKPLEDQILSGLSPKAGKKYAAPVFENLAILNGPGHEAETDVTLPSEQNVVRAKEWVDENEL